MAAPLIVRTPIHNDDLSGTTGTILDNAWKQELYDQIDADVAAVVGGIPAPTAWIPVPFNAANFSANGAMTWTVGAPAITANQYYVSGKLMFWVLYLSWFAGSNVVGGTPNTTLFLTLPGGLQLVSQPSMIPITYCQVAGVPVLAGLYASTGGTKLQVSKADGSNFAAGSAPGIITTFILPLL